MLENQPEITDLTTISLSYPRLSDSLIIRENIMVALEETLKTTETVMIEGAEGIGKTVLLAQFAKRNSHHAFSLFPRANSKFAYDSRFLTKDLAEQIGWVLKKENFKIDSELDYTQVYRARLFELQRHANSRREIFYFILDGLSDIPQEDSREREELLKLMPFGLSNFRFIISGPPDFLEEKHKLFGKVKSFPVLGFSPEETRKFFGEILSEEQALDAYKISKTNPGYLASIKRILQTGIDFEKLLQELPEKLPNLFEYEWKAVDLNDTAVCKILAVIANDKRMHTSDSLSKLINCDASVIQSKLDEFTFLTKNPSNEYSYVTDVFKIFAASKLSKYRKEILEHIIKDLEAKPESKDSLTFLPYFLNQAGKHKELIKYLSPEHIGDLIDCGDSWVPLYQKAELGLETALIEKSDSDLVRFSLYRIMIDSIEKSEPWRSEIEAYISIGDFSTPFTLVQGLVTKEDQLHLLAVIARMQKSRSVPISKELSDQIKQLYRSIDSKSLGKRGIEIASDMIYTHPELAIELVQESTSNSESSGDFDLALAGISFKTLTEGFNSSDEESTESTQQMLRSKVKDPLVQSFIDRILLFFGNYSADEVIEEIEKWEKVSDRIFALRFWCEKNAKKLDASIVLDYSIKLILKTTTFTASAKAYSDLASPLIFMPNIEDKTRLISIIDGLKGPIEKAGPTVEYVKLIAIVGEAEASYDRLASFNRTEELYIYVEDINDCSTKLHSLAILSRLLKKIDPDKEFDSYSPIHDAVVSSIQATSRQILIRTAEHFDAIRPAIRALAASDANIAMDIISSMNTTPRRDAGYVNLVKALASDFNSNSNYNYLFEAYNRIQSITMKSEATLKALNRFVEKKSELGSNVKRLFPLVQWIQDIPDLEERCKALCLYLEVLIQNSENVNDSLIQKLYQDLETSWSNITTGWVKVDSGFSIVSTLSQYDQKKGESILKEVEDYRKGITFDSQDTAQSFICCLRLAIRAFSGLIKKRNYDSKDLDFLKSFINKIPAPDVRVLFWFELSIKFYLADDIASFRDLVASHIRPAFEMNMIKNSERKWQVLAAVSPALFCAHPQSAKQLIKDLPQPFKDDAINEICNFLLNRRLSIEFYDHSKKVKFKSRYEDVIDMLTLLEDIEADFFVYWKIEKFVDQVHKKFKSHFNNQQQANILRQISKIVSTKFPAPNYIQHEGYKILAEAQIARLEKKSSGWELLLQRAKNIPNISDRAFTIIKVASCMPTGNKSSVKQIFEEAKAIIPTVATFEDRCDLYESLARYCYDVDNTLGKEALSVAWQESMPKDEYDLPKVRRRLIDTTHHLSPELASSLAAEMDNDPARELARLEVKKRLRLLELRENIGQKHTIENVTMDEAFEFSKMMLSSLNSERGMALDLDEVRPYVKAASTMILDEAYVVLSWAVENAVVGYADTDHAKILLRELFEAAKSSAELSYRLTTRLRKVSDFSVNAVKADADSNTRVVGTGEREACIEIIKEWVSKAEGFITITDPYFGLEELDFINIFRGVNSVVPIEVVTSRKYQMDKEVELMWDNTYKSYWRRNVSDFKPGDVHIHIASIDNGGASPIHDRWMLSEKNGLRLGTSLNSLGLGKISEISLMDEDEIQQKKAMLNLVIARRGDELGYPDLSVFSFKL